MTNGELETCPLMSKQFLCRNQRASNADKSVNEFKGLYRIAKLADPSFDDVWPPPVELFDTASYWGIPEEGDLDCDEMRCYEMYSVAICLSV